MTRDMRHVLRSISALVCGLCLSVGLSLGAGVATLALTTAPVVAQVSPFQQALAEAAASDRDIAAFYRTRAFAPLWTAPDAASEARRVALVAALRNAHVHGLPAARYDVPGLLAQLGQAQTAEDRAAAEVALSTLFLRYARDVQSGLLVPAQIDPGLVREVARRDRHALLTEFSNAVPGAYLATLPPGSAEYARLAKAGMLLSRKMSQGGWGPSVPGATLAPGQSGAAVVALRNRLKAMGYLQRSASQSYDAALQTAVQVFQVDHGLEADGVAGEATLRALNVPPETRLAAILVAMERERWLPRERGDRHILVNLTDFSARIMDDDRETFRTRAVIGKNTSDRRTPEFSDVMDHMVINPSWNVPRSITTREYLPKLKRNPGALSHLQVIDSRGRVVSRGAANFAAYSPRSFPYRLKQPPGTKNALGLVKFMFPNKYNIYLHDTPAKELFSREVRAYSHGCIRLHQPFDFAYQLLAEQEADPEGYFHAVLETGRETRVDLDDPVPVHITYRTAFTDAKGRVHFRADIYGRDAAIWRALARAGVSLGALQG